MNLKHARQRLLTAKAEITARLERTQRHIHHREPVSPNSHEQAVETGNDAVVQTLDEQGWQELQQIDQALQRIDDGTYPYCDGCGKPIDQERLKAVPWTAFCVDCA